MALGHQKREGEASEDSLGSTSPFRVLFVDVEQLAGVRQIVRGQCEVVTQLSADVDLFRGKVAGALLEAGEFLDDPIPALFEVLLTGDRVGDRGIQTPLHLREFGTLLAELCRQCREIVGAEDRSKLGC